MVRVGRSGAGTVRHSGWMARVGPVGRAGSGLTPPPSRTILNHERVSATAVFATQAESPPPRAQAA
jgi:hypothetical protein